MIILIQCANKFIKLVSDCSGDIAVNVIRVHEIKLPFILKYSLLCNLYVNESQLHKIKKKHKGSSQFEHLNIFTYMKFAK